MKQFSFLASQTMSLFAEEIIRFALPVVFFLKTGNAYGSSVLYCCVLIPRIVFGPFLSYLSDCFSPFQVYKSVILAQAFLVGLLPFIFILIFYPSLWIWAILVFTLSILNSVQYGAVQSILPRIWSNNGLFHANGLLISLTSASLFTAPLLAGFLLDQIGFLYLCLIGSVINFAAFFLQHLNSSTPVQPSAPSSALKKEWMKGWIFVKKDKFLLSNLFLTSPANFFLSVCIALLTPMVLQNSNAKSFNLGIIFSMAAVGGFLGGILCKRLGKFFSIKSLLWGGFIISGAFGLGLMGFFPHFLGLTGGFFLCGFGMAMINTTNQLIWQLSCPSEIIGRVTSIRRSVNAFFAPVGFLMAIPISKFFENFGLANPYSASFIFCGFILVLLGVVGMSLRSMDFEHIYKKLSE